MPVAKVKERLLLRVAKLPAHSRRRVRSAAITASAIG